MRTILAAALVLALAFPAAAEHCAAPGRSDWSALAGAGPLLFYVGHDACETPCLWVYEETNGVIGLQRDADTCHGVVAPDTRVL
ncbi:MAG TPA: hypothetical protein VM582_04425 [Candidatus Thermoplasmatota archaeon]|nr:hypothetical protein [Candidatus Thermoplasmatota archaeon]